MILVDPLHPPHWLLITIKEAKVNYHKTSLLKLLSIYFSPFVTSSLVGKLFLGHAAHGICDRGPDFWKEEKKGIISSSNPS